MIRYFTLTLVVEGPVLSKGSVPGDPGLDAVALRAADNALVLNGKHLEGRCRHAAWMMTDRTRREEPEQWAILAFGPNPPDAPDEGPSIRDATTASWEPKRGRISIEDLVCTNSETPSGARDFRLKRDEERQAGEDRMLAVLERAGEHGAELIFTGNVRVVAGSELDLTDMKEGLLRTLRWLASVGGEAVVGYGVLKSTAVSECVPQPSGLRSPLLGMAPMETSLELSLTFERGFCLSQPQLDRNIFESSEVIAGNAMAAAVRRALEDLDLGQPSPRFVALRRHFDVLRFRHALPVRMSSDDRPTSDRPIPVPLSWAAFGDKKQEQLVDLAVVDGPVIAETDAGVWPPMFAMDWKHELRARVNAALGRPEIHRELRTYTAIERGKRTARDQMLYSYELIKTRDLEWLSVVDLDDVPESDRMDVVRDLGFVVDQAPLVFGKTDSRAAVAFRPLPVDPALDALPADFATDEWIVMLRSPTLLLDCAALQPGAGAEDLAHAYSDAWEELSDGRLTLRRHFSSETLLGGRYLHGRFQSGRIPYEPYLLTDAGSVFVLASSPECNRAELDDLWEAWQRRGLPLGQWASERFAREAQSGDHWRNCPLIPQNGFGEIVVNHPAHVSHSPSVVTGVRLQRVQTVTS